MLNYLNIFNSNTGIRLILINIKKYIEIKTISFQIQKDTLIDSVEKF